MTPASRICVCNAARVRGEGEFVLYWMIAFFRLTSNFSLQRAVELAVALRKPLVIFEPLRTGYRWASDRIHRVGIDGMADNAAYISALKNPGVLYIPYVEPQPDAEKGLLAALANRASVFVTDDFPCFDLPGMVASVAARLPVRLVSVDSNGLFPLHATDRVFTTAFSFRAFLQKQMPPSAQGSSGMYLSLADIGSISRRRSLSKPETQEARKAAIVRKLLGSTCAIGKLPRKLFGLATSRFGHSMDNLVWSCEHGCHSFALILAVAGKTGRA